MSTSDQHLPPPSAQQYSPPPPGWQPAQWQPPPPPSPVKKRPVFLWFFLALQLLFVVWLVWLLATAGHVAASVDCTGLSAEDCTSTQDATGAGAAIGAGIGAAFIFGVWLFVDMLVGVIYGVYRLATRA